MDSVKLTVHCPRCVISFSGIAADMVHLNVWKSYTLSSLIQTIDASFSHRTSLGPGPARARPPLAAEADAGCSVALLLCLTNARGGRAPGQSGRAGRTAMISLASLLTVGSDSATPGRAPGGAGAGSLSGLDFRNMTRSDPSYPESYSGLSPKIKPRCPRRPNLPSCGITALARSRSG
jgi:hypothetical protein